MPRYILLPASGGPEDAPVFATALDAARLFGAHLAFLHVRPDVRHSMSALSAGDMGLGTQIGATMEAMETQSDAQEHAADAAWRDFCSREGVPLADVPSDRGVTAEWLAEVGSQPAWLAAHGRTADLIVMGRRAAGRSVALDVLETVLMETGRPVLIAPDKLPGRLADTLAIAWKDTRDAASAVRAALPFVRAASRVIVFTVPEEAETEDRSARRLLHALRWSNPNTSIQILRRDRRAPVEVLLRAAADSGSTLLAMGCYGHGRLREAVFGGFTRAVLEHAPLPVLMAH